MVARKCFTGKAIYTSRKTGIQPCAFMVEKLFCRGNSAKALQADYA